MVGLMVNKKLIFTDFLMSLYTDGTRIFSHNKNLCMYNLYFRVN